MVACDKPLPREGFGVGQNCKYGGTPGDSEFSGRKLVVIPVCAVVLNTKG